MEQSKKKWVKKLIVAAVVIGVLLLGVAFDAVRASMYRIDIRSINPTPVVADGKTQCELVVAVVDRKGRPQKGHTVYVRVLSGGGNFTQQRNTTDESGEILLSFKPLRAGTYNPATNVKIEIRDESNSVFFFIPTKITYEIQVVDWR